MIKRKDGRYRVSVLTKDGKRKYFYGKTQSEALRKLRDYTGEAEKAPLFGDVALEWLRQYEKTVTFKTMAHYNPAYDRVIEHFGESEITDIEAAEVQAFLNRLKDLGYSSSYIKAHRAIISRVMNFEILKKNGALKTDPTAAVKTPRVPKKKIHAATPEQEMTVIRSIDLPFGLYAFFLLYTGCRSQEALAVQWKDIDFDNNRIQIDKAVTFPHNQAVIKGTKTEQGNRIIPLLSPLKDELLKAKQDNGLLFVFGGEKPLSQQAYSKRWRQYTLAAGFRKEYFVDAKGNRLESLSELQRIPHKRVVDILLTPHQLRHSFATMCFEAGLGPEDAQKFLGHADIKTTVNIYTDIRQSKQDAAAEKLDLFVVGGKSAVNRR